MDKPFLVRGTVYHTPYMGKERRFDDIRLVMAGSAEEAQEKYANWWRAKTSEYSDYYHASGEAMETVA